MATNSDNSKKAIIAIVSGEKAKNDDVIEVRTPGSYYISGGVYTAKYDETEISGMEGTTTTIEIMPNKLSLIREGTTTAKMEFEKNNKYTTLYNTPYGSLELVISTKELKVDVNDDGGEVLINYDMSVSGQKPQKTELKIKIKTQ